MYPPRDVCNGMVYLSDSGFVHRDIAARNVLLNGNGQAKVLPMLMAACPCSSFCYNRFLIWVLLVKQTFMCPMREGSSQQSGQLLRH